MNTTKFWKRTLVGGAAALTLAAGLLMTTGVDTAYAQADPQTPDTGAFFGRRGGHMPFGGMRGGPDGPFGGFDGDLMAERQSRLAEALGISVDELDAAQETAREAALQDAIADGKISEEQAAMIQAHVALKDYIDPQAMMTQALGVSAEELDAARENGTLRELFSGLDLDRATIGEQIKATMDEALNQAVADGAITQEQADQLREQAADHDFGGKGFGKPGFGGRGGHGGPGGFGWGNN